MNIDSEPNASSPGTVLKKELRDTYMLDFQHIEKGQEKHCIRLNIDK